MLLSYTQLVVIRPTEGPELYYSARALSLKCKYFHDTITELGSVWKDNKLFLDLPFTSSELEHFLKYLDEHQMTEEGKYWFNDTPTRTKILQFALDVCRVADYVSYARDFDRTSLEDAMDEQYDEITGSAMEVYRQYLNSLVAEEGVKEELSVHEWAGPIRSFEFLLTMSDEEWAEIDKKYNQKINEFYQEIEEKNKELERKMVEMGIGIDVDKRMKEIDKTLAERKEARKYKW